MSATDKSTNIPTSLNEDAVVEDANVTFRSLGLPDVLCEACEALGWKKPTRIQQESIPISLDGRDVIALAETGSGKTGAFALPILAQLLENPTRLSTVVLTPTRELAFQIAEQFEALGASIGLKVAVIVGGMDNMTQSVMLAKQPHVVVATPGRLVDHLENTRGFSLRSLRFLVLDEADRILNMDFEDELNAILRAIPRERRTMLFSATMTQKVAKLQRAALREPVRVEVSSKYATVDKLVQHYVFVPAKFKDDYLVHLLEAHNGCSAILFVNTCLQALRIALLLRHLDYNAVPLHGQLSQAKRLAALNKFKSKERSLLIATDVASRGLDIPHVELVLNVDVPAHTKDYIHRVGRTARAGKSGKALTLVTQYDVELYQRVEFMLKRKLDLYKTDQPAVLSMHERIAEAQRFARIELAELQANGKQRKRGAAQRKLDAISGPSNGDGAADSDTEQSAGVRKRVAKLKGKRTKRFKLD